MTSANRIMWPFTVNWREPYEITYAFSTDIFTSRAGLETRRAKRMTPRKSLSHTALFRDDSLRQFNRLIMTGQNMQIIMPEVPRQVRMTQALAAGATSVYLVPAGWMAPGAEVVVGRGTAARLGVIDEVAVDHIVLEDAIGAFAKGERVYPALTGRLADTIDASRATNTIAQGKIIFHVDPGSETISETEADDTFAGVEICPWAHNWDNAQDISQTWPIDVVDYDSGVIAVHTSIDMPAQLRGADILCRNVEAAEDLLAFFQRMRGRQGQFMRASGEQDLVPFAPVVEGENTIIIKGRETFDTFLDDPIHGAIAVRLGGDVIFRLITAMVATGGNTVLTVDATWPTSGLPPRVSWFYSCRLEGDEITFSWKNDRVSAATLTSRTLPLLSGVDYTAYRVTPAGEDRVTPEGEQRIVLYIGND